MIKKYLENEYKEDIKNVFNTEPRYDGWFCIDYHNDLWTEIQDKNLALSKENPDRHLFFLERPVGIQTGGPFFFA